MVKSETMVINNKILSRGTHLTKTRGLKKGIEKRNLLTIELTILLTLRKLKGKFITQSNIKT